MVGAFYADGHERETAASAATQSFGDDVWAEVARARECFPPLHSNHEGLAVLLEEYREVEQLVFGRTLDRRRLYEELVQVAAMARRWAEDLALGAS